METKHVLIQNMPTVVWQRARAKALLEGKTIKEVVIKLLIEYLEK